MNHDFVIAWATKPKELKEVLELRTQVFVIEQNIPEDREIDDKDEISHHAIVKTGEQIIATGRLTIDANNGILSRIAVLKAYRGYGLGKKIVRYLEAKAIDLQLSELTLWPHDHLENFYADLGYETFGNTEVVAEHQLIHMRKTLLKTT